MLGHLKRTVDEVTGGTISLDELKKRQMQTQIDNLSQSLTQLGQ